METNDTPSCWQLNCNTLRGVHPTNPVTRHHANFNCFIGDSICYSNDEWLDLSGQQNNIAFLWRGTVLGASGSTAAIGDPPIAVYMLAGGLTAVQTRASLNAIAFIKEGISAISIFFAASVGLKILFVIAALFPCMLFFSWLSLLTI